MSIPPALLFCRSCQVQKQVQDPCILLCMALFGLFFLISAAFYPRVFVCECLPISSLVLVSIVDVDAIVLGGTVGVVEMPELILSRVAPAPIS